MRINCRFCNTYTVPWQPLFHSSKMERCLKYIITTSLILEFIRRVPLIIILWWHHHSMILESVLQSFNHTDYDIGCAFIHNDTSFHCIITILHVMYCCYGLCHYHDDSDSSPTNKHLVITTSTSTSTPNFVVCSQKKTLLPYNPLNTFPITLILWFWNQSSNDDYVLYT